MTEGVSVQSSANQGALQRPHEEITVFVQESHSTNRNNKQNDSKPGARWKEKLISGVAT